MAHHILRAMRGFIELGPLIPAMLPRPDVPPDSSAVLTRLPREGFGTRCAVADTLQGPMILL